MPWKLRKRHILPVSQNLSSVYFSLAKVSANKVQPFFCHDLANDMYSQTAKTVFSHLKGIQCKEYLGLVTTYLSNYLPPCCNWLPDRSTESLRLASTHWNLYSCFRYSIDSFPDSYLSSSWTRCSGNHFDISRSNIMDLLPWRFQSHDQQGRDLQPRFF